jgi:hypothetical protein
VERVEVGRVAEAAGDAVDVVVVGEGVEGEVAVDPFGAGLAVEGVGDLEVVAVVVARVETLVALVVGGGVERLGVRPVPIVAVDDLPHQPEVGAPGTEVAGEVALEAEVQAVGGVEPEPVDPEAVDPVVDGGEEVVPDLGIVEVELDQVVEAVPALVGEGVALGAGAVEVEEEPVAVGGALASLPDVGERPEVAADVVEDPVEDQAQPAPVEVVGGAERVVVAEAAVD